MITLAGGLTVIANADRFNPELAREYAAGNLSVDDMFTSGGLLFWCIYSVFQYGAELMNEPKL